MDKEKMKAKVKKVKEETVKNGKKVLKWTYDRRYEFMMLYVAANTIIIQKLGTENIRLKDELKRKVPHFKIYD